MSKILTLTIGIPAHNEEANIASLLDAIVKQKEIGFSLKRVIVNCDGCTDQTAQICEAFAKKHSFIRVIDDHQRHGQAKRLNQLYELSTTDIFVTFDADVQLCDEFVLAELIKPFSDSKVGLVGGNDLPAEPQNFLQWGLATFEKLWKDITLQIRHGNNVHNMPGRISAVRSEIIRQTHLPEDIVANDHFLYFLTIKKGWKFIFAPQAKIAFQLPQNFQEFILQAARFANSRQNIVSFFGEEIENEYAIPRIIKIKTYSQFFLTQPIALMWALVLQSVQQFSLPLLRIHGQEPLWHHIRTSKHFKTT